MFKNSELVSVKLKLSLYNIDVFI